MLELLVIIGLLCFICFAVNCMRALHLYTYSKKGVMIQKGIQSE